MGLPIEDSLVGIMPWYPVEAYIVLEPDIRSQVNALGLKLPTFLSSLPLSLTPRYIRPT